MLGPLPIQTKEQPQVDRPLWGKTPFLQMITISCTIAQLSVFNGYHLQLNQNGQYATLIIDDC